MEIDNKRIDNTPICYIPLWGGLVKALVMRKEDQEYFDLVRKEYKKQGKIWGKHEDLLKIAKRYSNVKVS